MSDKRGTRRSALYRRQVSWGLCQYAISADQHFLHVDLGPAVLQWPQLTMRKSCDGPLTKRRNQLMNVGSCF